MKLRKLLRPGSVLYLVFAVAVSWIHPVPASAQFYTKQYAVVIGINQYQNPHWPKLSYARKDAEDFGSLLRQLGFTVYALYDQNATSARIRSVLEDDLAPNLTKNDAILFFFAGHGDTRRFNDEDFGYIVPYDATDKASTMISMDDLRTLSLKMSQAKHQAFIMDCCYGGQLGLRAAPVPENVRNYLQAVGSRVGRQILTAGGKNQQVVDGGAGSHSVFTGYLLKGIRSGLADNNNDGWITFTELVNYITPAASSRFQTPGSGTLPGHEQGEFLFPVPKPAPQPVVSQPQPSNITRRSSEKAATELKVPVTSPSVPRTYFRSTASTLSADQIKKMLSDRGFFDKNFNNAGKGIQHQYRLSTRQGQQLVVDEATGLTWQQSGSPMLINYAAAEQYVQDLNNQRFAGYSDWRLPTLEEAMSLIEPTEKNGDFYVDQVFDKAQRWIWTADKRSAGVVWGVYFTGGNCNGIAVGLVSSVRAVRSGQ